MDCTQEGWTVRFPDVNKGWTSEAAPFEISPIELTLNLSREKYDFCRLKCDPEVGEEMKPHTDSPAGELGRYKVAEVCYQGDVVRALAFRPDWVEYGTSQTHIQLHDIHKTLSDGTISYQARSIMLREAYEEIINAAKTPLIEDIEFRLPENQPLFIYEDERPGESVPFDERSTGNPLADAGPGVSFDDIKKSLFGADYAIDHDEESPQKAIEKLNRKYNLTSWIENTPSTTLVVGKPRGNQLHIAAPDDTRIWRYKDVTAGHSREPIKRVRFVGQWIDEPGLDLGDIPEYVTSFASDGKNHKDVEAVGIATRTDIDTGRVIEVKDRSAKKEALPDLAEQTLRDKMKRQNLGSVELNTDPRLYGTAVSRLIEAKPGDGIQVVPNDKYWDNPEAASGVIGDTPDLDEFCGGFVNNDLYFINDVQHRVEDTGLWTVNLDVGAYPDIQVERKLGYITPSGEYQDGLRFEGKGSGGLSG